MKRILTLLSILVFAGSANAQLLDGLETVLLAKEDAQKLLQGYTHPLAKSFIYGLNTGWAHTAKTHKQLGFDLTLGVGASMVSDADLSFNPNRPALRRERRRASHDIFRFKLSADRCADTCQQRNR